MASDAEQHEIEQEFSYLQQLATSQQFTRWTGGSKRTPRAMSRGSVSISNFSRVKLGRCAIGIKPRGSRCGRRYSPAPVQNLSHCAYLS